MNTVVTSRTDAAPKPQVIGERGKFSMRGLPLLVQGTANHPMATVDNLWLSVKVYASGGENALHAHLVEDHAFVVLQGRATFFFEDGSSCEVLPFEGIMLPKGTPSRARMLQSPGPVSMQPNSLCERDVLSGIPPRGGCRLSDAPPFELDPLSAIHAPR